MFLSYREGYQLLKKHKIPIVPTSFFLTLKEVESFLTSHEPPYVLKIDSPDILHKTDAGCIFLGIRNKSELKTAYTKALYNAFNYNPNARIKSFILQSQITGFEIIIGAKTDPTFEKVVIFGAGGIFTEIYKDVSLRVVPLTERDIKSMIKETRAWQVLRGYRGRKYNLNSLFSLLKKVSNMVEKEPIEELDLNPVILNEKEALVADWRINLGDDHG